MSCLRTLAEQRLPHLNEREKFRALLRAGAITIAAISTFVASVLFQESMYYWAALPSVFVLLSLLGEFIVADVITEEKYPARTSAILEAYEKKALSLQDPLLTLIQQAIGSLNACDNASVNGTLHLIVELFSPLDDKPTTAFVQLTNYAGRLGGKRWRFVDASKGIIGRCLRTKSPEFVNFSTQEEFNDRMMREFGFTYVEMQSRTLAARSYWAHPITANDEMVGVLYLFSTEPQVFPLAAHVQSLDQVCTNIVGVLRASSII
jgi:GAF domain-containing protein